MRDVLDPVKTFNNFVRNWWKIVIFVVIGGLLGFAISYILPPTYEAEAINFDNLVGNYGEPVVWTQYEEDLALQVVERMLLKQFNPALRFARTLDPTLEVSEFRNSKQIERYLSMWYLRYRHTDPEISEFLG